MFREVEKCADALLHAILESEEYCSYQVYLEKLNGMPELKQRIDEYRKKNYELQKQDGIDLFEAVDRLEEEYKQLRKDTFANAYLEAELDVCKMLQWVQVTLTDRLNISIPEGI